MSPRGPATGIPQPHPPFRVGQRFGGEGWGSWYSRGPGGGRGILVAGGGSRGIWGAGAALPVKIPRPRPLGLAPPPRLCWLLALFKTLGALSSRSSAKSSETTRRSREQAQQVAGHRDENVKRIRIACGANVQVISLHACGILPLPFICLPRASKTADRTTVASKIIRDRHGFWKKLLVTMDQLQIQNRSARRINFNNRDRSVGMSAENLSLQIQILS